MPQLPNGYPVESRWRIRLPIADWASNYERKWFSADLIAGLTLAAYAIPVSLAYATLAGLPPQHGIYCYLFGGLAYAVFGTSKQVAIGPTSAIAMLVGASVGAIADHDPQRWIQVASLTACVVAIVSALAWLLRLSALISFISETILLGFKAGAALSIAMTQLPALFGLKGGGEHFFQRLWHLFEQLPQTNPAVLTFGLMALAILVAGQKYMPGRPIALVVVVLSILVMAITSLEEYGLVTVGQLPQGLPAFRRPPLSVRDVDQVIPLAWACFLLSYIESISAARTLAARHNVEVNPRQELLALGVANLAAGFGQGMPIAGGLSQSAVNDKAGARTPLALIVASITLAICLQFLTGLLAPLPTVVLAAVVLFAVAGLIDIKALRQLYRVSKYEFQISIVALIAVLVLGILKGVLLAAIASIVMLLNQVAHPHIAVLGRIPGTNRFSDAGRHHKNELFPGILIVRVDAPILYFNVEHVRKAIWDRVLASSSLRLVICDLATSPFVDVAGTLMLSALQQDLMKRGIQLRLVDAHAGVRTLLRAEGLEQKVGDFSRKLSIDQVIVEFERAHQDPQQSSQQTESP